MRVWFLLVLVGSLVPASPALALSPMAKEFMKIIDALEPVHCEKRKLRRAIAFAEAERRYDDARALRQRFAEINRDPETTRLERRLAELEPILKRSPDPQDLRAINNQRVEALYRCG